MMKEITITIEGNNFSTLLTFYDEVEHQLTKGLYWKIGRNLAAFNDVLRGGFGMHEYAAPVNLIWLNSKKSRADLGWTETILYLENNLVNCHSSNTQTVEEDLKQARLHKGETLFSLIIKIIKDHEHIQFSLQ